MFPFRPVRGNEHACCVIAEANSRFLVVFSVHWSLGCCVYSQKCNSELDITIYGLRCTLVYMLCYFLHVLSELVELAGWLRSQVRFGPIPRGVYDQHTAAFRRRPTGLERYYESLGAVAECLGVD